MSLKPYWQSGDGALTVYHARFEDVLEAGCVPVREVALIHDDPPYGVGERTDRASKGRGFRADKGWPSRDFPPCVGDDRLVLPCAVTSLMRPTVMWGANHYASRLPDSASWLMWDKRDGVSSNDNADAEIAWTNLGGPVRIFRHMWNGLCRASEVAERALHSMQKPIALCTWVYQRAKLKRGDLVFVPHMGSGPDLPACQAMGLRAIACDVEEWCCRTAVARLHEVPHPEPTAKLGPLFAGC